ncbi:MAG: hypothetical protein Q8861_02870 [Bacteroidota bacterium]|nr:hypothetical protein [Bacteroidota bacterium]
MKRTLLITDYSIYYIIVVLMFCMTSQFINGQNKQDTLLLKKAQDINKKFPFAHMVDFQYTYFTPSKVKTRINGKDFSDTKVNFQQLLTTSVNLPLYMSSKFMVINSFKYQYATVKMQDPDVSVSQDIRKYLNKTDSTNTYTEALNLVYIDKLFNKRIIFNLSTFADFSSHGYERINGSLTLSYELKHTDRTSFSIGMLGTTDPSASTPVIPIISFSHWFNEKYLFDCLAPAYLYFRRIYTNKSRLSLGANLYSYESFSHPVIPAATSFTYQRNKVELAAIYEKNLCSGLNLSSKIGYVMNMREKVSITNTNNTSLFLSQKPNFSFSIGVTYDLIPKKH